MTIEVLANQGQVEKTEYGSLLLKAVTIEDGIGGDIGYDTGVKVRLPEKHIGIILPYKIEDKELTFKGSVKVIRPQKEPVHIKMQFVRNGYEKYEIGEIVGELVLLPIVSANVFMRDSF